MYVTRQNLDAAEEQYQLARERIDELERENEELRANQIAGICKGCNFGCETGIGLYCEYYCNETIEEGYCHQWEAK